jgi:hypothetical protein
MAFFLVANRAKLMNLLRLLLYFLKQVKAVDVDDDMAAEIEYSIYENQSSGVKELFGINRHTGGIFLLKSAVPWGESITIIYLQ